MLFIQIYLKLERKSKQSQKCIYPTFYIHMAGVTPISSIIRTNQNDWTIQLNDRLSEAFRGDRKIQFSYILSIYVVTPAVSIFSNDSTYFLCPSFAA